MKKIISPEKIEHRSIETLVPYARNARTHSDAQVAQIAASIKEFGFTNPILIDSDNGIIAGHGRVLAARKLGMSTVPCIEVKHLTEAQKKAYIIADNKLALNAGWDNDLLSLEFSDLNDFGLSLDITGFNTEEIKYIMGEVNFEPATQNEQGKLDELAPKWVDCPHCGREFDLREQN